MSKWSFLFLLVGAFACVQAQTADSVAMGIKTMPGVVTNISVQQLAAVLAADSSIFLLDVRTVDEYQAGNIHDAKLIDVLQPDQFKDQIEKLDKDQTIYVYCRSGRRSLVAADEMIKAGFKSVINVEGGYNAWKELKN